MFRSALKYFYKNNGCVSSARNYGLDKAKGEFIAFLDSDDYWPKNYLEKMIEAIDNTGYDAAYCARVKEFEGNIIDEYDLERCKSGWITTHLFKHSFVWPSAFVATIGSIGELRFNEELDTAEDIHFFLKYSLKAKYIFVNNFKIPLVFSKGSLSQSLDLNSLYARERFYFQEGGGSIFQEKLR